MAWNIHVGIINSQIIIASFYASFVTTDAQ